MSTATAWLKSHAEIVIPILGVPLFLLFAGSTGAALAPGKVGVVLLMAAAYVGLIARSRMDLPSKEAHRVEKRHILPTALIVLLIVAVGVVISTMLPSGDDGGSGQSGLEWTQVVSLLLIVGLGTAGILAEQTLPVDLFPVIRRPLSARLAYVISAAFFVALWLFLAGGIATSLAGMVARLFGEIPPVEESGVGFGSLPRYAVFLHMLVGAGIFEELWFRVGIMTTVWALTRRWGWGLLVSSVLFGLYHISLSSLAGEFGLTPIYSVVSSTLMGAVMGCIYRYRGLSMAVLVHSLGNFLSILLLT